MQVRHDRDLQARMLSMPRLYRNRLLDNAETRRFPPETQRKRIDSVGVTTKKIRRRVIVLFSGFFDASLSMPLLDLERKDGGPLCDKADLLERIDHNRLACKF